MWSQPCLEGGRGSARVSTVHGRKQTRKATKVVEKVRVRLRSRWRVWAARLC
jgi:hypothetical protein